jgi:DnaK suppressor protein
MPRKPMTSSSTDSPAKSSEKPVKPASTSKTHAKVTPRLPETDAEAQAQTKMAAPEATRGLDDVGDVGDPGEPGGQRTEFLAAQRQLLLDERANHIRSAEVLKAQADSLALEHEPGDVQFDEEGGEGGTSNVDRELDLVLSAQARAAAAEIDRALAKIESGHYGLCEQCGLPIPDARLQALPQASLCVACKSGGLSSRR